MNKPTVESLIRHIVELTCPVCGSPRRSEEVTSIHCNAQQFESRSFKCGARLSWVPNFECMEVSTPCPKSASELVKQALCKQIIDRIKTIVEENIPWSGMHAISIEYAIRSMVHSSATKDQQTTRQ